MSRIFGLERVTKLPQETVYTDSKARSDASTRERTCRHCGELLGANARSDKKFCSSHCKDAYWNRTHYRISFTEDELAALAKVLRAVEGRIDPS